MQWWPHMQSQPRKYSIKFLTNIWFHGFLWYAHTRRLVTFWCFGLWTLQAHAKSQGVIADLLAACAHTDTVGALDLGNWIHNYAKRNNIKARTLWLTCMQSVGACTRHKSSENERIHGHGTLSYTTPSKHFTQYIHWATDVSDWMRLHSSMYWSPALTENLLEGLNHSESMKSVQNLTYGL